jgi:catechol 2,3-dioxygenase-like lactoylglutathione lyase family enzyme
MQIPEGFAMSFRFHHVHIICKDLEKMIAFFTEGLGADLVRRKKFGTADGASLDLQGTTINLRLARADEKMEGDASRPVYGYNHIGLEVEDIEVAFTDLSARGYSFFMPPTNIPELRIAFFRGPEDIVIELVQKMDAGSLPRPI